MIGSILSFIAFGLLVILSVVLIIKVAERRAYQIEEGKRKSSPVKAGDMYVLWNGESKRYNTCFLVKQYYEGYCVGTMYLFADGKKRMRDIVSAVVLHKKGFKNTDIYEFREVSLTDEEIKRVGFQRV